MGIGIDDRGEGLNLRVARTEDMWAKLIGEHGIGEEKWERIAGMGRFIYGDEVAVSGIVPEVAERYFLMASADEKTLPNLEQSEMGGRIIETQGKIILACMERARELPAEDPRHLALRQMAEDLFGTDLFTIFVPPKNDKYIFYSPISGRRKPNGQEEWAMIFEDNKRIITPNPSSKENVIGRTSFNITMVGITEAERIRLQSLRGRSAEEVAERLQEKEVGVKILYEVRKPEELPCCWIEAKTKTDERGSPVEFLVRVD